VTKKIFSRVNRRSDLLAAVPGEEGFVSLKTGERHDEALVTYKSALFTPDVLVERAQGIAITQPVAEYTLSHVECFKTGARIRHEADSDGATRFVEQH
jgi:hypothetical protein